MLADINGNLDMRNDSTMNQRFCLRWNNHQNNMLSVFDQLLHDESFVDVTLGVEGQFLKAHKMVLSACSPYFQSLFVEHPDKHPIVILKDVPFSDMRSLLDFMYRGEVSVDQERLTEFLRVAESLRIKGLSEVQDETAAAAFESSHLTSAHHSHTNSPNTVPPPPSLHRINNLSRTQLKNKYQHIATHPLLGSALTAPKRKRGRPRKLSGSSDHEPSLNESGIDLVQGSPEMMEMRMGLDLHSEMGHNSGASSNGSNHKKEEIIGNGDKEDSFTRPQSRQGSESFKQDCSLIPTLPSDTTFELCSQTSIAGASFDNQQQHHHHHRFEDEELMNEDESSESASLCIGESLESTKKTEGIHFLSGDQQQQLPKSEQEESAATSAVASVEPEVRKQLLEYLIQKDGTVVCKWCGEVLPSRTRWYRHKYKLHVTSSSSSSGPSGLHQAQAPPGQGLGPHQTQAPAPLYKCQSCNAYFKSRKGYIGHLSSRHSSDIENDENRDDSTNDKNQQKATSHHNGRSKLDACKGMDWEQQREKEEKLVADIIDRVKRECEAQGETVTRRGYSRRSTVMSSASS
ncbi:protein jim lovell isoform X2 [Trichogramma pretiosum]|uniref:protein jim lovell isoform X2 n=1 Tax=Trichogramma pretiosum TaxID=7493 RepID=UPI0006C99F23|nr:protein jim lovell isoform X2 [Trichogramma pretiosum]